LNSVRHGRVTPFVLSLARGTVSSYVLYENQKLSVLVLSVCGTRN